VVGVVACVALAQLIRPDRTNPPVDAAQRIDRQLSIPSDVRVILDRSCRDCHTNETRWPGYSRVAPISWLVAYDVNEGRGEMNLSEWGRYDSEEAREKLKDMCKEVRGGDMPVWPYIWMHPETKLSPAEVERLCAWTEEQRARPMETVSR
jgi:hypothetical protein